MSIPSAPVYISDLVAAVSCVAKANTAITWPANATQAFLLGVVALMIAAGVLAFFVLFNAVTCLCQCLSPCCRSPKFNLLLSLLKLAIALIGAISLGVQMNTLQAAISAMAASATGTALALQACVAANTVTVSAASVVGVALAGKYESQGYYEGKAFASLGVIMLGASALLHALVLVRCGGDEHHPSLAVRKPVTRATATFSVSASV